MFDYSKILGRAKEKGFSQSSLAKELGISANALTNKVKGKSDFKSDEIEKLSFLLNIGMQDIGLYFFTPIG